MYLICPSCEKESSCSILEKKDLYQLLFCNTCEITFSFPMKAGDANYYEQYTEYGEKWEFRFLVEQIFSKSKNGSLLDIGCGDGKFLEKIPKSIKRIGIDFNPAGIHAAKLRGIENVFCTTLSEFSKKNSNQKFNWITAFHIIEHLESPGVFLEEIKRYFLDKGIFILSVPNPNRWTLKFGSENWDYPPHHLTRWNEKSLRILLVQHNFKPIKFISETISTFSQVRSGVGDIVWKLTIRYFSYGLGKKINRLQASNTSTSPRIEKIGIFNIYSLIIKIKGYLIKLTIFITSIIIYPWFIFFKKQGKSLLVISTFEP